MILTNISLHGEKVEIAMEDGKFVSIAEHLDKTGQKIFDGQGMCAQPGLIDIHIHGCLGRDLTDGTVETADVISNWLAAHGVTSFCAALHSESDTKLLHACEMLGRYSRVENPGADLIGIYLEGLFFSEQFKGAQCEEYLCEPNIEIVRRLIQASDGALRVVSCAPELPGAEKLLRFLVNNGILAAAGHTGADFEIGKRAIENGIRLATHLFNGMAPIHHRKPGISIAMLQSEVFCELIGDMNHVHPAMFALAANLLGERAILVSDNTYIAGLQEGKHLLAGREVTVQEGVAYTSKGNLAGSCIPLLDCVKRASVTGIDKKQLYRMATCYPAALLGLQQKIGDIKEGMDADLILLDKNEQVVTTFSKGRCVYDRRTLGKN